MTPTTTPAQPALEDFEVRKLAAIGAVSTSSGLVERRPIEYRRELENQFVRGFRAAESRLHAQVAALTAAPGVQADSEKWWRKRADEIETKVAATGSQDAMRCYTDMRTLLQAATQNHPDVRSGYAEGWQDGASEAAALLSAPAQPAERMPSWMQYDERNDVLTIHGRRYAAAMFGDAGLLSPPGTLLRVEEGDPDCVTLYKVAPAQPAEGAAYAELPEPQYQMGGKGHSDNAMRDFADRTHALRASHEAPAEAVQRIVHLRADRERRVYVAGPMTGLPEYNFPLFNATAARLRAEGWHVENPAEHGLVEGAEWADYLRWDISRIATCGAIYLLPGWSKSKGSTLEMHIAGVLGMRVLLADGAESPTAQPAPAATPQADSQPVPANIRQISECYGDCPTDPKTCANPCKFEGRASRTPEQATPAAGAVAHTLSDAQIEAMPVWRNFVGLWPESRREIVDAVADLLAAAPTPAAQQGDADRDREDLMHCFWVAMGACETAADNDNDPVLRVQVEGFYRLWNRLNAQELQPAWVRRAALAQKEGTAL